eukprot:TRINITY_DN4320_c0_g1_i2.p1 TRINITY_DN4320_c0_g1~~TRINITY_DN4320_c0_g1_i2.p1  ORF type:complete len:194 (+),score=54.77 TRINITY_DN4320_c0_g1_i2:280-861(+)
MNVVDQLTNYTKHSTLPLEELEKRYDRLKRFGTSCDVNQHQPTNPSMESTIQKDSLHVYGVDYMSTEDVRTYFKGYDIVQIKWLNDSSCNVKFPSDQAAAEVMERYGKGPVEGESSVWRQGPEAELNGKKFAIRIRFATDKDVKDPVVSGRDSKYYKRTNAISKRPKRIHKSKTGFNLGLKERKVHEREAEIA